MKKFLFWLTSLSLSVAIAAPSEITVNLTMDESSYLVNERIRAIVDVQNMTAGSISVGYADSNDRLFVEVYRASDHHQISRTNQRPFVSRFALKANQGLRLETYLGDHYDFSEPGRFLARPVLVHDGIRFEGLYRAFDIVPGMPISQAVQKFSNREGLSRNFDLMHWSRQGSEHLFLLAHDEGTSNHRWVTVDIGPMMRITKPSIAILPGGEVIVIHRNGPDSYVRSEFWSMPDALDFRSRQRVRDPETAGQQRVEELYKKTGPVEAKRNPWWHFW